jgi:hypothetical protein
MDEQLSEIERAMGELPDEDRTKLERANDLYHEKKTGRDLNDWLVIGDGHNVRIRFAQRLARTNERKGRQYTKYLNQLMTRDGINNNDTKQKSILTALAYLCDDAHPERLTLLAEARAKMTAGELATLVSPHSARKHVKRLLDARSGYEPAPKSASPITKMKEENAELKRANAHLEEQLASKDDANTVFTPKDSAKDIVASIAPTLSRERLREIEKEIPIWLKAHPIQKPKPPKMK